MIATGSRPAAGKNAEWLDRGERWRADRPAAARSAAVTHGRGVQVVDGGGPGAQAFESSSGVAIFALILPRFIDYQQVIDTLQGLTVRDYLIVAVFGVIAWIVTGTVFTMLIAGLGLIRGLEAYLILTGIGASIPLGPWNMAVLWVVIRGWGRATNAVTGGILLYGIFDQLSRFGLMFVSGLVLIVAEGL